MTREMNKPDVIYCKIGRCYCTCLKGMCDECKLKPKERVLDDWIKPYINSINERFKKE